MGPAASDEAKLADALHRTRREVQRDCIDGWEPLEGWPSFTLSFALTPDGRTTAVTITGPGATNRHARCVDAAARAWRFPASTHTTYSFRFESRPLPPPGR